MSYCENSKNMTILLVFAHSPFFLKLVMISQLSLYCKYKIIKIFNVLSKLWENY